MQYVKKLWKREKLQNICIKRKARSAIEKKWLRENKFLHNLSSNGLFRCILYTGESFKQKKNIANMCQHFFKCFYLFFFVSYEIFYLFIEVFLFYRIALWEQIRAGRVATFECTCELMCELTTLSVFSLISKLKKGVFK